MQFQPKTKFDLMTIFYKNKVLKISNKINFANFILKSKSLWIRITSQQLITHTNQIPSK